MHPVNKPPDDFNPQPTRELDCVRSHVHIIDTTAAPKIPLIPRYTMPSMKPTNRPLPNYTQAGTHPILASKGLLHFAESL